MSKPLPGGSLLLASALVLPHTDAAFGYVGPAGIGALGVLLVVVAVLLIGVVGLVLHPIRLFLGRRRRLRQEQDIATQDAVPPQNPEDII